MAVAARDADHRSPAPVSYCKLPPHCSVRRHRSPIFQTMHRWSPFPPSVGPHKPSSNAVFGSDEISIEATTSIATLSNASDCFIPQGCFCDYLNIKKKKEKEQKSDLLSCWWSKKLLNRYWYFQRFYS